MSTFHMQIVTPDGMFFDGQAQKAVVRTTEGDVCILAGHADYVAPVATGLSRITDENGQEKTAASSGGLISVKNGTMRLVATTFEWSEDIDVERAKRAKDKAEKILLSAEMKERKIAEAKLRRAIARIQASGR